MKYLNLGILAHVDAGKTSLTERLLFEAGAIDFLGSVDAGNTQTDSLDLERQRGITIKSAVATFCVNDVHVNLIDTPGHPDFIAEVERVLNVLDAAILVVSAVEGVQAQTRVLMRALERLNIRTLIFVNKIDRMGARYGSLLRDIAEKLSPAIDTSCTVADIGTPSARVICSDAPSADLIHPVLFGSAKTGAGVDILMSTITAISSPDVDNASSPLAQVFKIERGAAGERVAYVRIHSGTLRVRDRLPCGRITAIDLFKNGRITSSFHASTGEIAKLHGLNVQIGDTIGNAASKTTTHFSPPTLETVVSVSESSKQPALFAALTQLAEQDPLINLRLDDQRRDISVSLYGEVQKEVIKDTLLREYEIDALFGETSVVCIERPLGVGEAVEFKTPVGSDAPPWDGSSNPYLATVGLRVEQGQIKRGVTYAVAKHVLGTMPSAFFAAIEEAVYASLGQGLYGWTVTDCKVTLTHTGYWPRQSAMHATFDKSISSTARDFRLLTPVVLLSALRNAGSAVCEPIHGFQLELPSHATGAVLAALGKFGAIPFETRTAENERLSVIVGEISVARLKEFQRQIPRLTNGEGLLESSFNRYQPVRGEIPVRLRTGPDPLNRQDYFRNRS